MKCVYDQNEYYGYIVRGDLHGVMDYLAQFRNQAERLEKYRAIFEREQYVTYDTDSRINALLRAYQQYYRDAFFLKLEQPEECLRERLCALFDCKANLDELEEGQVRQTVESRGWHFLGGRTGGYYGPYIWKTTEPAAFDVELPGGVQVYTVQFLDGFISKSWIDYLSFGEIGTGGWTDGDGVINCVKASYDVKSESFRVSLLKHEAQHARDLAADPEMSSGDLEYRAKLVELIYSEERNLLPQFLYEASDIQKDNGHAVAAKRIAEGFSHKLGKDREALLALPVREVRATAKTLFAESCV